ncbi:Aldolase-type TIM barrel [Cordyceps fumosorosea ARSEF 2679]|uniref:Alpha-galactosidase n=1 Tax=Cordyceps fumosorosea (strain ARSEF 2679) TaxID=1081104 RepID=A0A162JU20_CORFA|nr:Aldolase-type TIM barrel [Cordyceps fumosorosea ARSEF 2679]OAA73802.1 Aldolase-type TIM barrel [Cordyceps fumosorosea ARSEF 2679]
MKSQLILASAAGLVSPVASTHVDLPLPPMGFNNWARFTTHINQSIFTDAATAMAANGMLAAGYNRLNLDDAWSMRERAANGSMVVDPVKFPQGLPWLASFIKDKGFIPGIYTDSGTLSCGAYPAAYGHEAIDLKDFSDWGYEYLKMDGCNVPGGDEAAYRHLYFDVWRDLLLKFPKPVVFSNSAPAYFCGADNLTDWYTIMGWSQEMGQLARHSDDIINYDAKGSAWDSLMTNYYQHVRLARYQRPGFFNDPDFLNTDHPSYTLEEKKTHMALWSSFSAPLIVSADIPNLTKDELDILLNKDLIAIDQDPLVQQATLVSSSTTWEVLTKNLANGDRVLTVLNKGDAAGDHTVPWASIGIQTDRVKPGTALGVKDLWTGKMEQVKLSAGGVTAKGVGAHGTAVFRISGAMGGSDHPIVLPTGLIFNTFSLKCLSDDKSGKVTWKACDGSDSQTWKVSDDGHVNSLLRPDECLTDVQGKLLSRHSACHTDAWKYFNSGNLVNGNSNRCLTEEADGSATVADCGYATNEQVVGLPAGAKVIETAYYKN